MNEGVKVRGMARNGDKRRSEAGGRSQAHLYGAEGVLVVNGFEESVAGVLLDAVNAMEVVVQLEVTGDGDRRRWKQKQLRVGSEDGVSVAAREKGAAAGTIPSMAMLMVQAAQHDGG